VMVCEPSLSMHVESAVPMSLRVVFAHEDWIVVPVTTGLPEGRVYVPPANGIGYSLF